MIKVQSKDFDPGLELELLRERCAGKAGAVVSFTGLVRDLNQDAEIRKMTLEHYPGMTEQALAAIEQDAGSRWQLVDSLIIHRIGPLVPNDRIVFVAAASPHRAEAFRACEFMIDALKVRAPFWKKETLPDAERWVETQDTTPAP